MTSPITAAYIAELLRQALGEDKAREVVEQGWTDAGLRGKSDLSTDEALQLLDQITLKHSGLVGIAARCAKTHFHLSLAKIPSP